MSPKAACVVGAGASGIAALKECVRQGFKPVCYELDSDVGGIWHSKNHTPANTPATWESFVTNTSKFNNCYSDLPSPTTDPVYLPAETICNYFKMAVDHFGLGKYIVFNTRVIKIRKTKDHEQTGQWEVFTAKRGEEIAGNDLAGPRRDDDESLSRCHREVFDFVLVCTGYFKVPSYPDVPGIGTFKGIIQHSFGYNSPKPFEGQKVLVVGNKFSAIDVAGDISNRAEKVYLALGSGSWIIPRCYSNSKPFDFLISRSVVYSKDVLTRVNDIFIQAAHSRLDHEKSGIRPSKPPFFAAIGISDDLPLKIISGRVQTLGYLSRINGDSCHFQDGKIISGINAIVFCTGYRPDLSFLDLDVLEDSGKMELYKFVFSLSEKHQTLGLIGHTSGDFPVTGLFELQARFATMVMAGKLSLPSHSKMKADVDLWNAQTLARTGKYRAYFIAVIALADSIALEIGCYPSFWKVFFRNPLLAYRNWYGPILNAQFRLLGPDSQWDAAVDRCLSQYEEGCSSIRHIEIKELQRPDINGWFEACTSKIFTLMTVAAVSSFLFYKYQETLYKYL